MSNPFFTIGHSTRSIDEFVALLDELRMSSSSSTCGPFRVRGPIRNSTATPCPPLSLRMELHMSISPRSAGLRGKQPGVSPDVNAFWENASFHNYADYALSEEFRSGLEKLRALGHATRLTVMCAESLWWRCHRRIIADYLIAAGEEVFHILGLGHIEQARLTPEARIEPEWKPNLSEGYAAYARPPAVNWA